MDLLCSINIWPVLTLLFQGAVAGLIVLRVTKWIDNRKAKELTRKHAMLVYLEVKEHSLVLDSVLKNNAISRGVLSQYFDTEMWESSRCNLTELPMDDLFHIGTYYRVIKQLNNLLDMVEGLLTPTVKQAFQRGSLMCQALLHLLLIYRDEKNAESHREHYHRLFAQAESYQVDS